MRGNSHVQFLKGKAGGNPADLRNTSQEEKIQPPLKQRLH